MSFPSLDPGILTQPAIQLAIADVVLKATVLLSLAGLIATTLRRSTAAVRHLVWTIGLVAALAVPVLAVTLPRWELPVILVAPTVESASTVGVNTIQAPATLLSSEPTAVARDRAPEATSAVAATQRGESFRWSLSQPLAWTYVLLAVWLAGVLAIAGRLVLGVVAVHWLSRYTERVSDASWLPLAKRLADDVGVSPRLRFLRSPRATMPMAWGIVSPSVLMPADAGTWPESRLRIVLLHELAHVKRCDCLTHAVAQLACAVHWFNPLAWMAARHARTERERACDDLVLAAGTRGSDYADELLEVARVMRGARFPVLITGATLAMAHRSQLEGRLMAILDPKVPRSGISRLRAAGATLAAACAVLPFAAVQPWAYGGAGEHNVQAESTPAAITRTRPPAAPAVPSPDTQPRPQSSPQVNDTGAARMAAEALAQSAVQGVVQGTVQGVLQGVGQGIGRGIGQGVAEAAIAGLHSASSQDRAPARAQADPKMVAALTAALKDSDKEVREAAMHALVRLRDPSIFEPLVAALQDASAEVREEAAAGLAQLRDRRAVEPLVGALKDANADVREQAAFALSQLRDPSSVDALTTALKDQSPSVRQQVAFALGQIRDARSVDALAAALKDANADVREQAAFALGQIRDKRATTALAGAITDSSADVREQAVFALGQLRDVSAIDGLMTALRDANPDVRQQAAFALGQIRDRRAVEPLISALKDSDADVREQAAFGLGQIRDRSAVEALVVALKDAAADVREQVAFALGQIRDPRAIDALTTALKDSSADVRQQAAFALGQLAR